MSEATIRYEIEYSQRKREDILVKMRKAKHAMREAIKQGIEHPHRSAFGMSDKDAPKMFHALHRKHMGSSKVVIRAMAYALATSESNCSMGRIVAFPTAGGAGVIPGVIFSAAKEWKLSEQKILSGLFTASAVGKIIAEGATLSAAAGGCQAEVGAAVAMASAGLTELRGGTPAQCLNASAIALKSYLGLVCDPLGGLVAVPCIKRNMIGASVAFAASDASIVGIESFIPFDQVVESMKNIGEIMSPKLRETALGGLAVTEKGLKIRKKMGLKPLK